MKHFKTSVNLKTKLLREREKSISQDELLDRVKSILENNETERREIREKIGNGDASDSNVFNVDLLETDRIFHISQIRKICIDYRLRFLPTSYFKGGIPEEAITQIRQLESKHDLKIHGFSIIAPTKTFQLKKYDDPLLFAPIGNDYHYLIHQWGNDLKASRKWLVWPFRNLLTFIIFSVAISLLITWLTPETNLSRNVPMATAIIFLFAFKSIFAVMMYSFFILGKKFNASIWNSEFKNH
ncbi:MAG: hypothetical protein EOO50_16425 [Flavobacterium sp.]|uniref:hypothetical protein n=1 Tax=Flavobacterium sp. TaxID=239 RepID=UPI0012051F55|nr:hypothetical protein [Flavobacterium sp.]RZJ64234.1 MAG: hypothetical protein EOO50_16425 [Flavobacterium sp.]